MKRNIRMMSVYLVLLVTTACGGKSGEKPAGSPTSDPMTPEMATEPMTPEMAAEPMTPEMAAEPMTPEMAAPPRPGAASRRRRCRPWSPSCFPNRR